LVLNQKKNSVSSRLPVLFYRRDKLYTYFTKGDTMTDTVQQPAAGAAEAQQSNDLTINDLNAMKVIIDIASSRGAFKPNEMVAVGQTYTKLTSFLETVASQQAAQPQQPAAPTAPATAPTGA
jgi:hypothetical protein